MTPEAKAKELIQKYDELLCENFRWAKVSDAKACARICVEEIIAEYKKFGLTENDTEVKYWQSVLTHLQTT